MAFLFCGIYILVVWFALISFARVDHRKINLKIPEMYQYLIKSFLTLLHIYFLCIITY